MNVPNDTCVQSAHWVYISGFIAADLSNCRVKISRGENAECEGSLFYSHYSINNNDLYSICIVFITMSDLGVV